MGKDRRSYQQRTGKGAAAPRARNGMPAPPPPPAFRLGPLALTSRDGITLATGSDAAALQRTAAAIWDGVQFVRYLGRSDAPGAALWRESWLVIAAGRMVGSIHPRRGDAPTADDAPDADPVP